MDDFIKQLCERVRDAASTKMPLAIHAGQTKNFYGGPIVGEPLDMRGYSGIIDYEPRELVLTVRAGTPLAEIEAVMAKENQLLPFEPPHFFDGATSATNNVVNNIATIGGTVATGLSGPRRAYAGAVRDFVLGTRVVNGKGEDLRFGGRVIKNVAGYDVSRLMTGAMGTLGVLADLSFKVLPMPAAETTLQFQITEAEAIQRFNEWAGKPLPISATAWHDGVARLRLSGAVAGVKAAKAKLGGEEVIQPSLWRDIRDHRTPFFQGVEPLWRLSVPATTPALALGLPQLIEWGGALRWVRGAADAAALRATVAAVGGHVTQFRGDKSAPVFHPLPGALATIHRNLKTAFDPENILNRGRMGSF